MKVYNAKSDKPMTDQLHKLINEMRLEKNFNAKDYVEKTLKYYDKYKEIYGGK